MALSALSAFESRRNAAEVQPWHKQVSYVQAGWTWDRGDVRSRPVLPDLQRIQDGRPLSAVSGSPTGGPQGRLQLPARPGGAFRRSTSPVLAADSTVVAKEMLPTRQTLERLPPAGDFRLISEEYQGASDRMKSLRALDLSGKEEVDDQAVASFATGCPDLRSLDVSGCNLSRLSCVLHLCQLEELRMAHCAEAVTDSLVSKLWSLRKLRVLDLSFCIQVSHEALGELAKGGCIRLQWLSLASCPSIEGDGLVSLIASNPGLEYLSLALNKGLTDDTTCMAVRHLKRVKSLDLAGCGQLQRVPGSVARYCEYVEELCLSGFSQLQNGQVHAILSHCQRLRTLNLCNCTDLTEEALLGEEGLRKAGASLVKGGRLVLTHAMPNACGGNDALFQKELRVNFPLLRVERHAQKITDPGDISDVCHGLAAVLRAKLEKKSKKKKSKSPSGTPSKKKGGSGKKKKGKR